MAGTTTIVGVFNDYAKADQASRELINNGIPKESVHVESSSRTATAGGADYQTHEGEGGIKGFFHRMFGGDEGTVEAETGRYSSAVQGGKSVLVIDAPEQQIDRVVAVLNEYGAIDIDEDGDYSQSNVASGTQATGSAAKNSIQVVDEQMKVGKRSVQRGGVRVYSKVIDRPVEEQVTLRDEHVRVDRRTVDRPISEAELSSLRDQSFEMTETMEEPVVEKQARVREEVVLGKEVTERTETVRDSVRQTDVKVERFGDGDTGKTVGATAAMPYGATGQLDSDYDEDFRSDWQKNYSGQGEYFSAYEPSYQYGYRNASDPEYKGKSWDQAEPTLRTRYERDNPGNTWEKTKNAVRYGWDKVTGR